jgi:hypothetical protein
MAIKNFMRKRARLVNGLKSLAKHTQEIKDLVMVEIGSYAGESTAIFATQDHIKMVHAVDPWQNGYDDTDGASSARPMQKVEDIFSERMISQCNGKYTKHKMTGDEALSLFEDESLDMVYIDGNHQYEAVKNDIQKWLPKIKKSGYIAGHDWTRADVKKAVVEELGSPDKTFSDSSWIFKVSELEDKS